MYTKQKFNRISTIGVFNYTFIFYFVGTFSTSVPKGFYSKVVIIGTVTVDIYL